MENDKKMDIKLKTRKEKTITLFDRIESKSVESAVKKIMEINEDDRNYIEDKNNPGEKNALTPPGLNEPGTSTNQTGHEHNTSRAYNEKFRR